jgi:hypothetical protein
MPDTTFPPGTLAATVAALDALYNIRSNAESVDGPIREPGDDQPKWHDVHTAPELSEKLDDIAALLVKRGLYDEVAALKDAAKALCDLDYDIEEARAEVKRLREDVRQLEQDLYSERHPDAVTDWEGP